MNSMKKSKQASVMLKLCDWLFEIVVPVTQD